MTVRAPRVRGVELVLVAAGLALFAGLVSRLGGGTLLEHLRSVGAGIVLVIAQEVLAVTANTLGWRAAFPTRPAPPFGRLFAARIAGDAVNYLTPTGSLGGEFVRARLLEGGTTRLDVATSIAVAKVSQTVGQVAFVGAGLTLVLATIPVAAGLRVMLVPGLAALAAFALALLLAQRRGVFAPLLRLAARRGPLARFAHLDERLQRLDERIAGVHRAPGRPFLVSCAWFFLGWVLGTVEIALMLWLLGVPVTATRALAIEALSVAVDAMLFFVPGKVGTQEGGKVLIFTALGLDPGVGLAVGVLRRARELSWALAGLLIVARAGLAHRHDRDAAGVPSARLTAE